MVLSLLFNKSFFSVQFEFNKEPWQLIYTHTKKTESRCQPKSCSKVSFMFLLKAKLFRINFKPNCAFRVKNIIG